MIVFWRNTGTMIHKNVNALSNDFTLGNTSTYKYQEISVHGTFDLTHMRIPSIAISRK